MAAIIGTATYGGPIPGFYVNNQISGEVYHLETIVRDGWVEFFWRWWCVGADTLPLKVPLDEIKRVWPYLERLDIADPLIDAEIADDEPEPEGPPMVKMHNLDQLATLGIGSRIIDNLGREWERVRIQERNGQPWRIVGRDSQMPAIHLHHAFPVRIVEGKTIETNPAKFVGCPPNDGGDPELATPVANAEDAQAQEARERTRFETRAHLDALPIGALVRDCYGRTFKQEDHGHGEITWRRIEGANMAKPLVDCLPATLVAKPA